MARKSRKRRSRQANGQSQASPAAVKQETSAETSAKMTCEPTPLEMATEGTASAAVAVLEVPAENVELDSLLQEESSESKDVEATECEKAQKESTEKLTGRPRRRSGGNANRQEMTINETVETTLDTVSDAIDKCVEEPTLGVEPSQETEQFNSEPSLPADDEVTVAATDLADECVAVQDVEPAAVASEIPQALLEEIIATNTAVLQQVVEHISQIRSESLGVQSIVDSAEETSGNISAESVAEIEKLGQQIEDLYQQLDDAQFESSRLKSELEEAKAVKSQPANTPAISAPSGLLTWEQRKEQMLKEMEEDSFDAESFLETIQTTASSAIEQELVDLTPEEYVVQLNLEFGRIHSALKSRDEEVSQLQEQLQGRPSVTSGSPGADTAIEDLVDVDSLLQDERERLQAQQKEWEERFRETEIATSLERAKLSRERRELARQNSELEEQLIHTRRENEADLRSGGKGSRRWLAMLGLSED